MATPSLLSIVIKSQGSDTEIEFIRDQVRSGTGDEGWVIHTDGGLRYRGRIVVPQLANLREEILMEFHCSHFSVHPGGMKQQVRDFVRQCLTCQQVKAEHLRPTRLLQPLKVAKWKLEHVTMDFVTHFPRTLGRHDAMWVIMDQLTKSAHFLVVRMTFTLEEFCRLYIREIIRLHGVTVSIVSNRDPRFIARFLGELPTSHGDTVDDERHFSSLDGWSVKEDHPNVRGHVASMRLGS